MIDKVKNKYSEIKYKILTNKFWEKLLKNALICLTGQGGASAINFITLLIMTSTLGTYNYALVILAQSYMMVLDALINFQSWQGVIKFGCEAIEQKDENKLASIIKAGFLIDMVSGLIGAVIAIIFAQFIQKIFNWDSRVLILMILFSTEIAFHIEGTPTAILRLMEKFHLATLHAIISASIRLIIIISYFTFCNINLYTFTIIYVGLDIFKNIFLVILSLNVIKNRIGIKKVIYANLNILNRKYYEYTIWSNMASTCDMPVKYFDIFFLSTISVEIVAVYKVFKQMLQMFNMLINPLSQAIMPQLGDLIAKGENSKAYSVVIKIRNSILILLTPIILFSNLIILFITKFYFEPIYSENYLIFLTLSIFNIATLSYTALHPCFSVMGFAKESTKITLLSNICYVLFAYYFMKLMGVYGIILASFIQFLIVIIFKSKVILKFNKQKTYV